MILAVYKGARNGLIIAVFSIIGWILGLVAALKFSGAAADYLKGSLNLSHRALSIIGFIAVFMIVMIIVRLGAKLIEKTAELVLLGWLNRLGGIIFYVLLYAFIFSVVIGFAEKMKLITQETIASSRVYPRIKPLARITQLSFIH
jgi:membrane protein required for colicin V production